MVPMSLAVPAPSRSEYHCWFVMPGVHSQLRVSVGPDHEVGALLQLVAVVEVSIGVVDAQVRALEAEVDGRIALLKRGSKGGRGERGGNSKEGGEHFGGRCECGCVGGRGDQLRSELLGMLVVVASPGLCTHLRRLEPDDQCGG